MTGVSALSARLSALPGKMRSALERAALDAARKTAEDARHAAPVRTGALRASIAAIPVPGGAKSSAGAPYAAIVEGGSRRAAAQPFLRPAFEMSDFAARAARAIQEELR